VGTEKQRTYRKKVSATSVEETVVLSVDGDRSTTNLAADAWDHTATTIPNMTVLIVNGMKTVSKDE